MNTEDGGFHHAWESLLLDFEEVLVGNAATDPAAGGGALAYPVFDRPFSIVKMFHHPLGEMGLELRADGYEAVLSMFQQDSGARSASAAVGIEPCRVTVTYDELLDVPDTVMAQVLSFLPRP